MQKRKLTKKERKAQRKTAARHRKMNSSVVRCFMCGSWRTMQSPTDRRYECCCGFEGLTNKTETMRMSELVVDEWTDRMIRFWSGDELEHFAAKAAGLWTGADSDRLFIASNDIIEILSESDCWTDEERSISRDVPDLQRVDWDEVAKALRDGRYVGVGRGTEVSDESGEANV